MKRINTFIILSILLFACTKPEIPGNIPRNAKHCGDHLISCKKIKKGMFYCEVFDSQNFTLTAKGNFIAPYSRDNVRGIDVSNRVLFYDGKNIFLKGNIKLVPSLVPGKAVRIKGRNGWVWIWCAPEDKAANVYNCRIFSGADGSLIVKGKFVVKKYLWNHSMGKTMYLGLAKPVDSIKFKYYTGVSVTLDDKLVLLPLGWMDYPEGDNYGKQVLYDEEGNELDRQVYSY
jgi:hypothetical protein